jgi:hypothetical protein
MYLLGHTDPTLTMRVYQQVIDLGEGGAERRKSDSLAGNSLKRMKGLEPSTFCMASRP